MTPIHPVILCGGNGSRLWPLSRPEHPKPFLPLLGERTLFQECLARVSDRTMFAPPIIVAGPAHVGLIEEQANGSQCMIIAEPEPKNTAPAIALAAMTVPVDSILLVCPSDHHITQSRAFRVAVQAAAKLADSDWLVAIGIEATSPHTGYGYIRVGEPLTGGYHVERFVEKPDSKDASAYFAAGDYLWNAGIYAFRAGAFLDELSSLRPTMVGLISESLAGVTMSNNQLSPSAEPFGRINAESVDYAVMEHTGRAAAVKANMGWSDIGTWESLVSARANNAVSD